MDILLQLWGGCFYLLNKIFFSLAEGRRVDTKRRFKLIGWMVYIAGVFPWLVILVGEHNWITAAIELGGVPSMVLGLLMVYSRGELQSRFFDRTATFSMYSALTVGVSYSLIDYGGLTAITQVLELGAVIGFLVGGNLLAKNNHYGWLFFMLMNLSVSLLMLAQGKNFLFAQQLVSLGFVIFGFISAVRVARLSPLTVEE